MSIGFDLAGKSAFVLTAEDLFVVDMDRLITEIATNPAASPPVGANAAPQPAPVPAAPLPAPPADRSFPADAAAFPTPPPAPPPPGATPTPRKPLTPSPFVALTQDTVRDIQTALTQLGYNPGPVDGLMGRQTEGALSAWRLDSGLPPSDPMTEADLGRLLLDSSI